MGAGVWFGNAEKQVFIPGPKVGSEAPHVGRSNIIILDGGGAIVDDSQASHREFTFSWAGDPAVMKIITEFVQGVHGPGPYWWADPFAADTNIFAPQWATPRLCGVGDWPEIFDVAHTSTPLTGANTLGFPMRSAVYDVSSIVANAAPAVRFTILIPQGMQLAFGVHGSRTGSAVVALRPLDAAGAAGTVQTFAPLAVNSTSAWSATNLFPYSGGTRRVEVYLTRTTTTASTITLAGLRAVLLPEGGSVAAGAAFASGEGSSGLRFAGGVTETLEAAGGRYIQRRKTYSVRLVEVEAWEQ